MTSNSINMTISDLAHMGWLYPNSAVAQIICPDLVAQARENEWDVQRFIREALPRIQTWAGAKLGADTRFLDLTCQNFIYRMMTRRPDLFADATHRGMAWYITGVLKKVHRETCREEHFGQQAEFLSEIEDPGQGPLEAITGDRQAVEKAREQERAKVVGIVRRLVEQLPLHQRYAVARKFSPGQIPELSTELSNNAIYVSRSHGVRKIRDKAETLGLRLSGVGVARGRIRRLARKPRGRALPRPRRRLSMGLREAAINVTLAQGELESMEMSIKQQAIDARNAMALKALFDSLPESLKDRIEVLAAVRETFEREFARRLRQRRQNPKEPPAS